MAACSLSEILSFLNLPLRSPRHFPIGQNRLTQGINLGMVCVQWKNQSSATVQKKAKEFWKIHPVHAPTPHRAGTPLLVRVGVVVLLNQTPEGAHHETQENPDLLNGRLATMTEP